MTSTRAVRRCTLVCLLVCLSGPALAQMQLSNRDLRAATAGPARGIVTLNFVADPKGGEDFFEVISPDPNVAVSLVTPSGVEVTALNAVSLGFGFDVIDGAKLNSAVIPSSLAIPGIHTLIRLAPNPQAGTYQVKLDGAKAAADAGVVAIYTSSSAVRAGVQTGKPVYALGAKVTFSGFVYDGTSPLGDAKAELVITDVDSPLAKPEVVPLSQTESWRQQGLEGIYGGLLQSTRIGRFLAVFRVSGTTPGGVAYSRTASHEFRVIAATASLVSFEDTALDDNGDGVLDAISVSAKVKVQLAGAYRFGLSFSTSSGATIKAADTFNLTAGDTVISVRFSAAALQALDSDGPFERRNAVLVFLDDPETPAVDLRSNAGLSGGYALAAFRGSKSGAATVTPSPVDFGDITTGKTRELKLTIRNSSAFPITESVLPIKGAAFSIAASALPLTIPPGGVTELTIACTPERGLQTGALTVFGVNVPLAAMGRPAAPIMVLTPAALDFGTVTPNSTKDLALSVSNTGDAVLNLGLLRLNNDKFTFVAAPSNVAIQPGGRSSLTVRFAPKGPGPQAGILTFLSNAETVMTNVPVSGMGGGTIPADAPVITVTPATLQFGSVDIGTTKDLVLTVSNTGKTALTIQSVTAISARFAKTSPASPTTVAPNVKQSVTIRFSPLAAGPQPTDVTLLSNDPATPSLRVPVSGIGSLAGRTEPVLHVSEFLLDFGTVDTGRTKDLQIVLTNSGKAALKVQALTVENANFSIITGAAAATIAPGSQQTVTIRFAPRVAGSQRGILTIRSDDPDNLQYPLELTGKGSGATSP